MNYTVGDKVRYIGGASAMTFGKEYAITKFDEDDPSMPVAVNDDDGDNEWLYTHEFEPLENTELTELRAWKERALARFPALAQRETDDEAAERFRNEFFGTGDIQLARGFLKAFAWARANPA